MYKTTLTINGMACGMCEAHVNDAVRRSFNIKKVSSSHKKGIAEVISESELDESKLRETIAQTGYELTDIKTEEYVKKGLCGR